MCFSKHIFKSNYFVAEDTRQVYEGKVTKMSNTWYVVIKSIPPICTEKLYPKILSHPLTQGEEGGLQLWLRHRKIS